jgi:hypothetical protein
MKNRFSPIATLLALALFVCSVSAQGSNPAPTQTFPNTLVLQGPDAFVMYWSYNGTAITFEFHVKNSAWFLFGIQGATFSDVIVAALYSDTTGYYAENALWPNNTLTLNTNLGWFLQSAQSVTNAGANYTIVKVIRNIKLQCGQSAPYYGLDIAMGTNTLVFATGTTINFLTNAFTLGTVSTQTTNLLNNSPAGTQFSCVTATPTPTFTGTPTGSYQNYVDLFPGIYRLYWNITGTNFTAEIHCMTNGFVGFGFSPDGGMVGSNVVVGFIASDGSVNFTDRYITAESVPGVAMTTHQMVTLLASGKNNGYMYFKFTRNLTLCDSQHLSIDVCALYIYFVGYSICNLFYSKDLLV